MFNRRYFFQQLASGLVAAVAPSLFLPKLIKPGWKPKNVLPKIAETEWRFTSKNICFWFHQDDHGDFHMKEGFGVVMPKGTTVATRKYTIGDNGWDCQIEVSEV